MVASLREVWCAYRLRWKRRRFLFRIWRKRKQIASIVDRTDQIAPDAILAFVTVRNEMIRLPYFLDHYRGLGVDHFLIVDNGSDDGTAAFLAFLLGWGFMCFGKLQRSIQQTSHHGLTTITAARIL